MSIRAITKALCALLMAQMLVAVSFHAMAQPQEVVSASANTAIKFAGSWVDRQNAGIQMSVHEDGGLFRITGGDEAYGYQISCLVKGLSAVCTGNGGRLEGENFLYQSSFQFNKDGTLTESWKAFNNLQTVTGNSIWKRP